MGLPLPPNPVSVKGTVGLMLSQTGTPPVYEPGPLFTTVMLKVQVPVDGLHWAVF
jgi:hypothetical protein